MVSCTIVVILGHTVPPQTLLIKTCAGVSFPAFWRANHGVLIATVQATFFNVNAKEMRGRDGKRINSYRAQLKLILKNIWYISWSLYFSVKSYVSSKTKSTRSVLFDSTQFFGPKWFLLNRKFDQTFRTILQPSFNGLIVAASGPPSMLTSELTVNVNI